MVNDAEKYETDYEAQKERIQKNHIFSSRIRSSKTTRRRSRVIAKKSLSGSPRTRRPRRTISSISRRNSRVLQSGHHQALPVDFRECIKIP